MTTTASVKINVRPSFIICQAGNHASVNKGESVQSALDRHIEDFMSGLRQKYMDGCGYGVSVMSAEEIREIGAEAFDMDEETFAEKLAEAIAKYGDEIPESCGPMGCAFGDKAEDESDICRHMEVSGLNEARMTLKDVSYIIESVEAPSDEIKSEAFDQSEVSHGHVAGDEFGPEDFDFTAEDGTEVSVTFNVL